MNLVPSCSVSMDQSSSVLHLAKVNPEYWGFCTNCSFFQLLSIFTEAQNSAPSLIFIDELDGICPKRDDVKLLVLVITENCSSMEKNKES